MKRTYKRAPAEQQRAVQTFRSGQRVRITRVAFPEVEDHAKFVGAVGTVTRTIKTMGEVCVQTDELGPRYCFPENLEAV